MSYYKMPCRHERLKFYRRQAGLRQIDVANILGVSKFVYERWEEGTRAVPAIVMLILSECLEISVEGLFLHEIKEKHKDLIEEIKMKWSK